jgi:hypothetical protein
MRKVVMFRLDVDLVARAGCVASKENGSLTNLIETLLKQRLAVVAPVLPEPGLGLSRLEAGATF